MCPYVTTNVKFSTLIGYGKSFASFGEVVQGRTSGDEDFLVTLPINLWSTCELRCTTIDGPLVIECDYEKSKATLYQVLNEIGVNRGYHLDCKFTRNIPIGKGLSSSTADMLAAVRALQELFGFVLTETFISRVFANIEPHDALHFNNSVVYNHRKGYLVANYGYIPNYTIIAVDDGGILDTVEYNHRLHFDTILKSRYDRLLERLNRAYGLRDDLEIAACATESAKIHLERTGSKILRQVFSKLNEFNPLGLLATHSGTCVGFIYGPPIDDNEIKDIMVKLSDKFGKEVFATRTLKQLN